MNIPDLLLHHTYDVIRWQMLEDLFLNFHLFAALFCTFGNKYFDVQLLLKMRHSSSHHTAPKLPMSGVNNTNVATG